MRGSASNSPRPKWAVRLAPGETSRTLMLPMEGPQPSSSPRIERRRLGAAGSCPPPESDGPFERPPAAAEVALETRAVLTLERPEVLDLGVELVALLLEVAEHLLAPVCGLGVEHLRARERASASSRSALPFDSDSSRSALVRASPTMRSASFLASSTSSSALRVAISSRRAAALDASGTVSTRIVSTGEPTAAATAGAGAGVGSGSARARRLGGLLLLGRLGRLDRRRSARHRPGLPRASHAGRRSPW